MKKLNKLNKKSGSRITGSLVSLTALMLVILPFTGCRSLATEGRDYSLLQIDLSEKPADSDPRFDELYELVTVDDGSDESINYLAHPDSVLLDEQTILTLYPRGHGMGAVGGRISRDGGRSWEKPAHDFPSSWEFSRETPTVYRLGERLDEKDPYRNTLVMVSANPSWGGSRGQIYDHGRRFKGDGFNASLSTDNGESWSEFTTWYGFGEEGYVNPIVAMASLTRLKDETGEWKDEWMGFFHDYDFVNYKSILSFNEKGEMVWSRPEPYFSDYRRVEKFYNMCEVELVRSDEGAGDTLVLLARSNNKVNNSLYSVSRDEGKSWSSPRELPAALNGERHKAEWLPDGRLFITFRSIERDPVKRESLGVRGSWYSEGWIGWIGTLEDILEGREGEYRIKLAHTYLEDQSAPAAAAHADTGYCGNVLLPDGTLVTTAYGRFGELYRDDKGRERFKTYIVSKRLNVSLLDELAALNSRP